MRLNRNGGSCSVPEISRSFSREIVLTVSNDKDGDSLYSRSFRVDSSNPRKSEEVIVQEIVCALSEDSNASPLATERRTLRAEIVPDHDASDDASSEGGSTRSRQDETLDDTYDGGRSLGTDTFNTWTSRTVSESAFDSGNDNSLLVENDQDDSLAMACRALFCNAF